MIHATRHICTAGSATPAMLAKTIAFVLATDPIMRLSM